MSSNPNPNRWAWLPEAMPATARLLADRRQRDGQGHVEMCWRRGMAGEPGWFFAREGPIAIGTPWEAEAPDVGSLLPLVGEFEGAALIMLRPVAASQPEPSIADKVAHVKRAGQTRDHECHWPGCKVQVPPAVWGCRPHWYTLPKPLRDAIWRAYRPGQEETGTPSREYLDAATAVQAWIAARGK
jgi:hypothetical protein